MGHVIRLCVFVCVGLLMTYAASAVEIREESLSRELEGIRIDVKYPVLGQASIDSDLANWARQLADNFQTTASEDAEEIQRTPYELRVTYTVTRPSDQAVSVVWEVWSYTGGAHGNIDIITLSYDTNTSVPLELYDIFKDLDTALNTMSELSRKSLQGSLGTMLIDDMLLAGTSPDADNFSSFALIPTGIRIFFQPYQVAPWAAGTQTIDISLKDLEGAGPDLSLWGQNTTTQATPEQPAKNLESQKKQ